MNDQFGGATSWEDFLGRLETALPTIRAIGLTDYYSTDVYERIRAAKDNGRLANLDLIFPNVEMRLDIGTVKGHWVNLHLLVSPEDPNHLIELRRILARLTFVGSGDTYCCTPEELIVLGQRSGAAAGDALRRGSEQFKVSLDQLKQVYEASDWARDNILIAVSGNDDGSGGVRDAADTMLRQKINHFAHIIFAGSPAQRDFWLGLKPAATVADLVRDYGGPKPCLHGSDAHDLDTVARPDGNRFSWVKGEPAFDTLRQALIDPAGRAFVGDGPPILSAPSQVIDKIIVSNANWAATPAVALNPGLVAIIGPRGSGKTALADMIAAGADALAGRLSSSSFLGRAREVLNSESVTLHWKSGETAARLLSGTGWDTDHYPRIRYLSQQFVEDLCSAAGMTDDLVHEIERVIFEAHPAGTQEGAIDFNDLLETRARRHRETRDREEAALAALSERIGNELEKRKMAGPLASSIAEKVALIERNIADRNRLIRPGGEERAAQLADVMAAIEVVQGNLRVFANQQQTLLTMKDEVADMRRSRAPETLRQTRERHAASWLAPDEWALFLLGYTGDVDTVIENKLQQSQKGSASWRGVPPVPLADATASYITPGTDLQSLPIALLQAEATRLQQLVTLDRDTAGRFSAVSQRIATENAALVQLRERHADCEAAATRIPELAAAREATYQRVFDAVLAEQSVLEDLYAPLMAKLAGAIGSLGKLSFSVHRTADIRAWAAAGEALLDLRQKGPFKGRGTLEQIAEATLRAAWERGDSVAISAAITKFRVDNLEEMLERARVPSSDELNHRSWLKDLARWMYGTDHIHVAYSIDYDGIDIRKLSPGTRGIVLLLLYLALDDEDDRPLLIDQPEENLDPKSIFDELVPLFVAAKRKRQVILVTHNANLVINTDADQIIVASAGPHGVRELPPISYLSGGLENAAIRREVCNILEGGEQAFQERARRLRVKLAR